MTNFYKCAGLLLTQQYENTLIMAPSYMWQYHFLERKSLVSQATAVVHKLSPGEWHWILLLFDWSSHTFDVGQGSLHSKYLVKLKEWCDKYSSNYYHKGKKTTKNKSTMLFISWGKYDVSLRGIACVHHLDLWIFSFSKHQLWIWPKVLQKIWIILHSDSHCPYSSRSLNDIFIIVLTE